MANDNKTSSKSTLGLLPNMLLSTTYALNKSYTKRVTVGLEYTGGLCKPLVKLFGSGSKHVTLDIDNWELIVNQLDAMNAYLQDSFSLHQDFKKLGKIFLPNHDICFTTAYGTRAIVIGERSTPILKVNENEEESETSNNDTATPVAAVAGPSDCKKKKYENPPSIVMQLTTIEGFKQMRECVSAHLKYLEDCSGFVNRVIESLVLHLKDKINKDAEISNILNDVHAFKQYYSIYKSEIEDNVKTSMEYDIFKHEDLNMVLLELYSFGLYFILKDLNDIIAIVPQ